VSREEGEVLAAKLGAFFVECSARTGSNVEQVFETITRGVLLGIEEGRIDASSESGGVKVGEEEVLLLPRRSRHCC
jgi:GTPase SAR1 family protein